MDIFILRDGGGDQALICTKIDQQYWYFQLRKRVYYSYETVKYKSLAKTVFVDIFYVHS